MAYRISTTEYLNYESGKFSKSKNTGVFGDNAQDTGIPADVYRYYLIRNRPENTDTTFMWSDLAAKCNNELLPNLGNYVNRSILFLVKSFDSIIPDSGANVLMELETKLVRDVSDKVGEYVAALEAMQIKEASAIMMAISTLGNVYLQRSEPWVEHKRNVTRCGHILYMCLALVKLLGSLLRPFMPSISDSIFEQLNLPVPEAPLAAASSAADPLPASSSHKPQFLFDWRPHESGHVDSLVPGHRIGEAKLLINKIEAATVEALQLKFGGEQKSKKGPPFEGHLVVGTVTKARNYAPQKGEAVPL